MRFNAKDLPRLTFGHHFKRTTTNITVRGETLRGDAGVDDQFKVLAAKGTSDGFGRFHRAKGKLPDIGPQATPVF